MTQPTTCRSCGAKILFARTTSSKAAPFEEDPNGLWVLANGVARFAGTTPLQLELGEPAPTRYTSHFAKCPDAAQWRGR